MANRFFVHDLAIDRYTLPGGEVFSYTRSLAVEMEREAKALAPVRTGALRSSLHAELNGSNRNGTNFRITAGADHALYVVYGTRGKTHHSMRLYGENPGGWLNTQYAGYVGHLTWSVRGQLPNPFLQEALHAVLIQHGLI